ncbi:MAG: hypothetical protein V1660_03675 [archaeon]
MKIAEIVWVITIAIGIGSIFGISSLFPKSQFEIGINSIITSLAILALVWIHIARISLSPASNLRHLAVYIFLCLIFMFLFSSWNLITTIFDFKDYWGYIFIAFAFMFLIMASYKLMRIGTEFGFSAQAKGITKLIKAEKKIKQKKK